MAIELAFLLGLVLEILGMRFTLPSSLSRALGKQFEFLALIFVRNTFKELSGLPEPISLTHHHEALWHILSYGFGAIAIFALLGVYTGMLKKLGETLLPAPSLERFIASKKIVALCTLILFCGMGLYNIKLLIIKTSAHDFFRINNSIIVILQTHRCQNHSA